MNINIKKYFKSISESDLEILNHSGKPIFYSIPIFVGICLGVVCETLFIDVYNTLDVYYVGYLQAMSVSNYVDIVISYSAYNILFLIAIMLSGLCAVGYIFLTAILLIKGLGIGCISAYLYSEFALKGVLFCLILIIPASLILLFSFIASSCESSFMSKDILRILTKKESENIEADTKLYILRFFVFFIILIFSSILYAVMCRLFIRIR